MKYVNGALVADGTRTFTAQADGSLVLSDDGGKNLITLRGAAAIAAARKDADFEGELQATTAKGANLNAAQLAALPAAAAA